MFRIGLGIMVLVAVSGCSSHEKAGPKKATLPVEKSAASLSEILDVPADRLQQAPNVSPKISVGCMINDDAVGVVAYPSQAFDRANAAMFAKEDGGWGTSKLDRYVLRYEKEKFLEGHALLAVGDLPIDLAASLSDVHFVEVALDGIEVLSVSDETIRGRMTARTRDVLARNPNTRIVSTVYRAKTLAVSFLDSNKKQIELNTLPATVSAGTWSLKGTVASGKDVRLGFIGFNPGPVTPEQTRSDVQALNARVEALESEIGRWKRATVTLFGYDDPNYNKGKGRGGTWKVSKQIRDGETIAVPDLGTWRSDKKNGGDDCWSAAKVVVSVPSK